MENYVQQVSLLVPNEFKDDRDSLFDALIDPDEGNSSGAVLNRVEGGIELRLYLEVW